LVPEDAATVALMDRLFSSLQNKLQKVVGYTAIPLDTRFITDLMRYYYDTDCAMIAGGTIRGDVVYPPGILRIKDIVDW
jgi:5'-nucleotidase